MKQVILYTLLELTTYSVCPVFSSVRKLMLWDILILTSFNNNVMTVPEWFLNTLRLSRRQT